MDGRQSFGRLVERLRLAAFDPAPSDASDAELLQRFRRDCDAAALEQLIRRHGRVVLHACRRQLRELHDVEDCFQAVWLILARKAASIRRPELLASWLYGVARRTAIQARVSAARRRAREQQAARPEAVLPDTGAEWWEVLDRELARLPQIYRAAVLLCDVEGLDYNEAARRLGWPAGTLAGRLARGRRLLARRLAQQGITLTAAALAQALAVPADAAVAPVLAIVAADAAALFAGAPGQLSELVSSQGIQLAHEVLHIMHLTKLKVALALVLAVAVIAGIGGTLVPFMGGGPAPEARAGDELAGPANAAPQAGKGNQTVPESARVPRPEDKLATLVSVNFKDVPLSQAVADLRKLTKLNLMVEWDAFGEREQNPKDQPVTLHLDKVPVRTVLRHLWRSQIGYYVADDVVVLTTDEEANRKMLRRVYPVADLVATDSKGENLIDVIRKIVDPFSWQMQVQNSAIGGMGGVPAGTGIGAVAYFAEGRCLVVLQSTRAHEEIAELLAELRATRPAQKGK